MPSAVSNQNNYYAAHHRRQSSQSQTNLPDQIRNSPVQNQTPNRSLVFLPSTAYSHPQPTSVQTSSTPSGSRPDLTLDTVQSAHTQNDPHDFYRQYQDPFTKSSPLGLHQAAIRTTTSTYEDRGRVGTRKSSFASTQSTEEKGTRSERNSVSSRKSLGSLNTSNSAWDGNPAKSSTVPNGLRSRKASFKDLVARFDASPEEVPPLPSQFITRPTSRTASPMPYASVEVKNSYASGTPATTRTDTKVSDPSRRTAGAPVLAGTSSPLTATRNRAASSMDVSGRSVNETQKTEDERQLLFGEVLPTSSSLQTAGYGIQRGQRRGSEGSPMHSPNPMFSTKPAIARHGANSSSPAQYSTQMYGQPSGQMDEVPLHRRANSDLTNPALRVVSGRRPSSSVGSAQGGPQSRIPVSKRHQRMVSEPSNTSPSTQLSMARQLPLRITRSGQSSSTPSPSGEHKSSSPRRGPQTPIQIKSPGRRPKAATASGEKSSSLRANIIAPPPKVSPPLRSSRPRLPVSAATTAASRAKMAEKAERFQTMAKQQSDGKAYRRQRPPELTDIDLKARRLKITQALTRSKEGQELKGHGAGARQSSTSRNNSIAPSDASDKAEPPGEGNAQIPAVVVDEPRIETSEESDFYGQNHPDDQRAFTQSALRIVEGGASGVADEPDSPILGHTQAAFETIPFSLNTRLQPTEGETDPRSAVTEGTVATDATEATVIDAEPQIDADRLETPAQSLLHQVNTLRSQISYSPLSSASPASAPTSDHADEMSVRLMLRETTYLDDDEAVRKGYRPIPTTAEPLPIPQSSNRASWTSSIGEEQREQSAEDLHAPDLTNQRRKDEDAATMDSDSYSEASLSSAEDDSNQDTAVDAYTIVNIVLQQRTPSGVVDQQLVDDIYHRIIQASPDLADADNVDEDKVQRLCLKELEEHHTRWGQNESSHTLTTEPIHSETSASTVHAALTESPNAVNGPQTAPVSISAIPLPPQSFRSHKYKSSLDSAEDWAETSPSVTDWIQFAANSPKAQRQQSSLAYETPSDGAPETSDANPSVTQSEHVAEAGGSIATPGDWNIPRPPSHSPPPPPAAAFPSIDQTSWSAPVGIQPAVAFAPPPSRPLTAVSQISGRSSLDHQVMPSSSSTTRPSTEEQSPEQRRLNKRRHVLKELVDTEYTYERDMRVLCDIYKQTAVAAISDEDIKIIFGNVDAVQQFSKDFLGLLKQVVKPAYVMERSDRRKDGNRTSTLQSSSASTDGLVDMNDVDKDELTRVGQAFEASMSDMEKVYTEYIRTRHAANKRLEVLQMSTAAREWLKECKENSSDITNAWSLDALLVKPIQRITKYPLLLHQLVETTVETHPDLSFLRRALSEVTDVNGRINEVKKHTELVDQVLNRKRKESDVRNGLTKAFGRRAEKLRQHVGINEMYEDEEYAKLKIKYDNNIAHLFLVSKDCQGYIEAMRQWVTRMCELAAAAEAWVDVGHTNHSQAESRLRQFAIVVRGINSIALPDHVDQVNKRVLGPMEKTASMLERFQNDPKGLIQKRDKRLLDYNQFKNKKDRGEKIDKKSTERMEQWEALNIEAKERKKRLLQSTADLVLSCQANLVQLHLNWLNLIKQKFSAAMDIPLENLDKSNIVKDWQEDFDYQEASALALSICNGSLLAEAGNLLSFLTPGTTLTGDDSPRQPSWNSISKRSISMNDDSFTLYHRQSEGPVSSHSDDPSEPSSFFAQGRFRATSAASGRVPKTPDTSSRGVPASIHTANSTNVSRPGTSPGLPQGGPPPRLSFEAPSPSLGIDLMSSPQAARERHTSTSTFYSATPGPSQSQPNLPITGGSVFSSAMPMEDDIEYPRAADPVEGHKAAGVLFTAASVYEFNIDHSRQQGGFRYLTYVTGEIFDVIAEHGELWLAINQDDPTKEIGWIWNKHFARLAE
ncbi:hypothetical protein LTR10_017977 [Elasticomyces elasticus]|uniref:Dynamin-binding protein n=1 Tax=Exophiala sideris TaxID=1016849 RepID=A0ABR0JA34_9EURO|nr:hypothetical protein LTR10_017977 [Elasticomyces elasticus]KAK5026073.1 hypothetical protein LTS07_007598 [Exophiala sideris]KAK5032328.1 hypothetical protein LTR13_007151 [Exophiala sideris]KAK5059483.1 hypothetical protein LTR69_006072 [Exophiala sideris]KAK5186646.1 hypothetical protein LTR44_000652 [Eurotiomycetes sp. CCFEE 6388]